MCGGGGGGGDLTARAKSRHLVIFGCLGSMQDFFVGCIFFFDDCVFVLPFVIFLYVSCVLARVCVWVTCVSYARVPYACACIRACVCAPTCLLLVFCLLLVSRFVCGWEQVSCMYRVCACVRVRVRV